MGFVYFIMKQPPVNKCYEKRTVKLSLITKSKILLSHWKPALQAQLFLVMTFHVTIKVKVKENPWILLIKS